MGFPHSTQIPVFFKGLSCMAGDAEGLKVIRRVRSSLILRNYVIHMSLSLPGAYSPARLALIVIPDEDLDAKSLPFAGTIASGVCVWPRPFSKRLDYLPRCSRWLV